MKNILNPKWIFIINTLPIALLFFIYGGQFAIIKSLLSEDNIATWKYFSIALGAMAALNFGYAIYLIASKKIISNLWSLISLVTSIVFIYVYALHSNEIIPFSVPRWMVSEDMIIYVGTFLMPTLAYSLFTLVIHFTNEVEKRKSWVNFLFALAIPVSCYLSFTLLSPLWKFIDVRFDEHILIVLFISGTLLFLFFIIRGIYILALKKSNLFVKYQLLWKIPICILFPLMGLALNNGGLPMFDQHIGTGMIGNFSSYWFYVLAIINGVFICLPSTTHTTYRLVLFIGRCITFGYTSYFFLVFLPLLPFSLFAVILFGLGFLMLTPLVLFIVHIQTLATDIAFLSSHFSKRIIRMTMVASFLTLPICITATYIQDKITLTSTLDYIYHPNYEAAYSINKSSLKNTIEILKKHKDQRGGGLFGRQTPYLSTYFNWLVLDNLTLSESKINTIERIFFDTPKKGVDITMGTNSDVKITNIKSSSVYNKTDDNWTSWVDIELTNSDTNSWQSEYRSVFNLPAGCWVSNYYLNIEGRKEMGILAEKKTAQWVYSNIVNTNRDPGILHYLTGNNISFRVFPFVAKEVRQTGIEFIHKYPVELAFDNIPVALGDKTVQEAATHKPTTDTSVFFVSAEEKSNLPIVARTPYYHFIVDISLRSIDKKSVYIDRIKKFTSHSPTFINASLTKVSFVNAQMSTTTFNQHWEESYNEQSYEGGFYLDRAIKRILCASYEHPENTYPVMICVTDSLDQAIIENNYYDYKFTYPEQNSYYHLTPAGELDVYLLEQNSAERNGTQIEIMHPKTTLAYPAMGKPIAYLENSAHASIVLKNKSLTTVNPENIKKDFRSALSMQAMWMGQLLHPDLSKEGWLHLTQMSFKSTIMMPTTSYVALENEAQKAMLLKKQEQVLSSNKAFDLGEDTQQMSEPGIVVLGLLLLAAIWYKEKRRRVV